MARITVSLPDSLMDWAESLVAEGRYSSAGDYACELVRRDREDRLALRRLQAALDEGRASGETDRTIEDIIADRRRLDGRE